MSGLYAIPSGVEFATAFARGFWTRFGDDTLLVPRIEIIANTARASTRLTEALAETAGGSALLPQVTVITELGADPLAVHEPPAVPELRRRLRLIRLVERYLTAEDGHPSAAPALADSLVELMDELDDAGIGADDLDPLDAGDQAHHWQQMLRFVDLVRREWPAIRAEEEAGAPDRRLRQRLAIEALVSRWSDAAPGAPVIAAGSTASVPSTRLLLTALARLPNGYVVLPGFDRELPETVVTQITKGMAPEHPQTPFAALLADLSTPPSEVAPWLKLEQPFPERHRLLSEALRPAPVTDAWLKAAPALAREATAATEGVTLIEAAHPREEAAAIALAIREALEDPVATIALVTPDASLARRTIAELARFDITPDDSLGRPLRDAPPGVYLRLLIDVASGAGSVALAGLLQHPLTRAGMPRSTHLSHARRYDRTVLRQGPAVCEPGKLPPWRPLPPYAGEEQIVRRQADHAWSAGIEAALSPLAYALAQGSDLSTVLAAHRQAADRLSSDEHGTPAVWEAESGAAARSCLDALAQAADAHGDGAVHAYPTLLSHVLSQVSLRPDPIAPHPRVAILGPREARTHPADVMILGGLTDGIWPALPGAEPWLSRAHRSVLGLSPPEARIGLSAHDFTQAAQRPRVILSRSARRDGTPAVPSRWLSRLTGLMAGLPEGDALGTIRDRGDRLLTLSRRISRPEHPVPRAPRPKPNPRPEHRPTSVSLSDVARLISDPYAVYARRILGLRPIDPLGRPPDAAERGEALHDVLHQFVAATKHGFADREAAHQLLDQTAAAVLMERVPWPDLRRLWQARIARFADWFVEGEIKRRLHAGRVLTETDGELVLPTAAGPITVTARADRIDLRQDGSAAVFDYKSGSPPTAAALKEGKQLQIPIEAAILTRGGFTEAGARPVHDAAYLGLTGKTGEGGVERRVPETLLEDPGTLLDRLGLLLGHFATDGLYVARGRPAFLSFDGDYDHLSRRAEWEEQA
ncbi:MAG: double-strand break repair protein AddB [Pseudomonadota bacterium]